MTLHQDSTPCATIRHRFLKPTEFATSHASLHVTPKHFRMKEQGSFLRDRDNGLVATFSVKGLASLVADSVRTHGQNVRIGQIECKTGETYEIVGWRPEPHTSMFYVGSGEHHFVEVNQNEETIWIKELPDNLEQLSVMLCLAWRWIELPDCGN